MTPEQLKQVEERRKEREDELLLILLLLLGIASRDPRGPAAFPLILSKRGSDEIAESMADSHLDAYPIFGVAISRLFDRPELIRLYRPIAQQATDAMIETIAKSIVQAGGNVAAGLAMAGYSASNTTGIELGAERNIVTASNAGLLAASIEGTQDVTGLEHLSVIDDATTDICRPRDGLRLPVSHPYWRRNWPSLHWNCRSIIVPLTGSFEASVRLPETRPLPGFGVAPPVVLRMLELAERRGGQRGAAA